MFDNALIDDFQRPGETPLSDSGKWAQMYYFGANDYLFIQGGGGVVAHVRTGGYGPAYAIRQTDPDPAYDQEIYAQTTGFNPTIARLLLRADNALSFYEFAFSNPGGGDITATINRWVAGTPTTIGSGTAAVVATDFWVHASAVGDTLTADAWEGSGSPSPGDWTQIAQVTDSTLTSGLVGIGLSSNPAFGQYDAVWGGPVVRSVGTYLRRPDLIRTR